jgi:peptide/nickel transport system permease protein
MFARAGAMMEPAALEALKATFGFVDGPIGTQFLTYVKSVFTWDLGTSVRYYPQPVADVLGRAIGWTLFLVGTSTILSFSIGSIVGIFAAWYRGGRMDSILSPLTLVMQAIPPWWSPCSPSSCSGQPRLAAHRLRLQPRDPRRFWLGTHQEHPAARHHAGGHPGRGAGRGFLITMRNNMINLLGEDYITMAKAKGSPATG